MLHLKLKDNKQNFQASTQPPHSSCFPRPESLPWANFAPTLLRQKQDTKSLSRLRVIQAHARARKRNQRPIRFTKEERYREPLVSTFHRAGPIRRASNWLSSGHPVIVEFEGRPPVGQRLHGSGRAFVVLLFLIIDGAWVEVATASRSPLIHAGLVFPHRRQGNIQLSGAWSRWRDRG